MQSTKTAQTIQYETYSIASSQATNNATIDVIANTLHNVGVRSNVDSILSFDTSSVISVAVVVTVVDRSVDDDCSNNDDKWDDDDALDTTEVVPVDASSSSIGNACNVVDEESMGEGVSSCCFCNKDLVDDDVGGGTKALQ